MKNNKKGFTLVELLAVIVVLAIIMIIAVPSVMDSMDNARKGSFRVYAQKVLTTAETKHQVTVLNGTNQNNYCTSLTSLMGNNTGSYKGYVVVCGGAGENTKYYITLTDNNFSYSKKAYGDLKADPVDAITEPKCTDAAVADATALATYCS